MSPGPYTVDVIKRFEELDDIVEGVESGRVPYSDPNRKKIRDITRQLRREFENWEYMIGLVNGDKADLLSELHYLREEKRKLLGQVRYLEEENKTANKQVLEAKEERELAKLRVATMVKMIRGNHFHELRKFISNL